MGKYSNRDARLGHVGLDRFAGVTSSAIGILFVRARMMHSMTYTRFIIRVEGDSDDYDLWFRPEMPVAMKV
jgi:hypothetical protein